MQISMRYLGSVNWNVIYMYISSKFIFNGAIKEQVSIDAGNILAPNYP